MNCSAKRRGDENRWENSEERGEKRKKYPDNVKIMSKVTGVLKESGYIREKRKEAERKGDTREKGKKHPCDVERDRSFKRKQNC